MKIQSNAKIISLVSIFLKNFSFKNIFIYFAQKANMKFIKDTILFVVNFLVSAALFTFMILFFNSCKKETYDLNKFSMNNFNGEYAAPLVASDLTIRDILAKTNKDSSIVVDNTGFCTLVYRGTLFTSRAKDFVSIPNQNIGNTTFDFSNTTSLVTYNAASNGTNFGPYSQNISTVFTPTPPLIDSLYTNSGTLLQIKITNSMPAVTSVTLTSTSIIDLNTSSTFNQIVNLPAATSTIVTYDLGNHLLRLVSGTNRSVLNLSYSLRMQKTANALGTEQFGISAGLTNIDFNKFIGYLGANYTNPNFAPFKDTVPITLFKSSDPTYTNTIFSLVDPKFEIKFYNEVGAQAKVNFTKLDAYTPDPFGNNLNSSSLSSSSSIQNINILPALGFPAPKTTTLYINKTVEPNVVPFINSRPKNVIYEVNGMLNPGGGPYIRNFFTDTSKIRVDLDVLLPLWGNMSNLVFLDTIKKIDLSNINPYTKKINLRTYFESTFPIDMGVAVIFTDSAYNTLYTLIAPGTVVIPGASVDVNGNTSAPKIYKKDYTINQTDMPLINKSKNILIKAFANTSSYPTNVKIYDFQKLKVRIGIDVIPYVSSK